ncbi:hypothetical protein TNCV_2712881 [Trichonephila clavipes]|uniref:Uncharacterized protein n=1 Tax=Trichonephila clavipes TaxID=2585209 RepID=A0A8X6UZY0_TRICX|nr:hypothetical protein TNCV_2712881 [Trichonephila clavipes]
MLMTWTDNRRTFVKKYLRRPPGRFITLLHSIWQLASRLEGSLHESMDPRPAKLHILEEIIPVDPYEELSLKIAGDRLRLVGIVTSS